MTDACITKSMNKENYTAFSGDRSISVAQAVAQARAEKKPLVGLIGVVAPIEIVLAAGCIPLTLTAQAEDWNLSAAPMEEGHEPEVRSLFRQALAGAFADCDLLIIPSTSDGYRFLYQYLKEMKRQGRGEQIPPLFAFDFLFGRADAVRSYSKQVAQGLLDRLTSLTGKPISKTDLQSAIHETNRVRQQCQRLAALRYEGLISGQDAHRALRAGACQTPSRYADALENWLAELSSTTGSSTHPDTGPETHPDTGPNLRPRLLLISAVPLYHDVLHAIAEHSGALVISEDDDWGARRASPQIPLDDDPLEALFAHTYQYACSPRMLRAEREAWVIAQMQSTKVDGVVFYIPPSDQSFGWRYPDLKAQATACGLPSCLLRDEVLDPESHTWIAEKIRLFLSLSLSQFVMQNQTPTQTKAPDHTTPPTNSGAGS